jgi:hypothetical protein
MNLAGVNRSTTSDTYEALGRYLVFIFICLFICLFNILVCCYLFNNCLFKQFYFILFFYFVCILFNDYFLWDGMGLRVIRLITVQNKPKTLAKLLNIAFG